MRRLARLLITIATSLALSSCIIVEDFGTYWNKGKIDSCIEDILSDSILSDHNPKWPITMLARYIQFDHGNFFMIKDKPKNKGGNLYRYVIEGQELVFYRLNQNMREKFQYEYHEKDIVITNDTATVKLLNENTVKILDAVSADPDYWIETARYLYNPRDSEDCSIHPSITSRH